MTEQILIETMKRAHRLGLNVTNIKLESVNDLRIFAMQMNQFSDYLWTQLVDAELEEFE